MTRPFVITGPNRTKKPVPVDERTGLPLPPQDTRAGTFIACADCAARPLDKLCCGGCPRTRSLKSRIAIRKEKED
jgi:hypothetical protein